MVTNMVSKFCHVLAYLTFEFLVKYYMSVKNRYGILIVLTTCIVCIKGQTSLAMKTDI